MSKKPNAELIDEENPEWTDEMFKQSTRFAALPESLQAKLLGRPKAASPKSESRSACRRGSSSTPGPAALVGRRGSMAR